MNECTIGISVTLPYTYPSKQSEQSGDIMDKFKSIAWIYMISKINVQNFMWNAT